MRTVTLPLPRFGIVSSAPPLYCESQMRFAPVHAPPLNEPADASITCPLPVATDIDSFSHGAYVVAAAAPRFAVSCAPPSCEAAPMIVCPVVSGLLQYDAWV